MASGKRNPNERDPDDDEVKVVIADPESKQLEELAAPVGEAMLDAERRVRRRLEGAQLALEAPPMDLVEEAPPMEIGEAAGPAAPMALVQAPPIRTTGQELYGDVIGVIMSYLPWRDVVGVLRGVSRNWRAASVTLPHAFPPRITIQTRGMRASDNKEVFESGGIDVQFPAATRIALIDSGRYEISQFSRIVRDTARVTKLVTFSASLVFPFVNCSNVSELDVYAAASLSLSMVAARFPRLSDFTCMAFEMQLQPFADFLNETRTLRRLSIGSLQSGANGRRSKQECQIRMPGRRLDVLRLVPHVKPGAFIHLMNGDPDNWNHIHAVADIAQPRVLLLDSSDRRETMQLLWNTSSWDDWTREPLPCVEKLVSCWPIATEEFIVRSFPKARNIACSPAFDRELPFFQLFLQRELVGLELGELLWDPFLQTNRFLQLVVPALERIAAAPRGRVRGLDRLSICGITMDEQRPFYTGNLILRVFEPRVVSIQRHELSMDGVFDSVRALECAYDIRTFRGMYARAFPNLSTVIFSVSGESLGDAIADCALFPNIITLGFLTMPRYWARPHWQLLAQRIVDGISRPSTNVKTLMLRQYPDRRDFVSLRVLFPAVSDLIITTVACTDLPSDHVNGFNIKGKEDYAKLVDVFHETVGDALWPSDGH